MASAGTSASCERATVLASHEVDGLNAVEKLLARAPSPEGAFGKAGQQLLRVLVGRISREVFAVELFEEGNLVVERPFHLDAIQPGGSLRPAGTHRLHVTLDALDLAISGPVLGNMNRGSFNIGGGTKRQFGVPGVSGVPVILSCPIERPLASSPRSDESAAEFPFTPPTTRIR